MNTLPPDLDNRTGGVVVDLANSPLNKKAGELRDRMRHLIRSAALAQHVIPRVSVRPEQLASLMAAVNAQREKSEPHVIGLAIDGIPITVVGRGAA